MHLGDQPAASEVVVTGSGQFSHRTLSCAVLHDGRHRAIFKGWASGGFYAVTKERADRFIVRCGVCWAQSPTDLGRNPESSAHAPDLGHELGGVPG